jgi:hypothetical protein
MINPLTLQPMTIPLLLIALLIALLCGAVFLLLRGGSGWRLLLYFGLSALGLAVGQGISAWRGWHLWMLGALDIGMSVIGSLIFLALGDWLTRIDRKKESSV